jgi:hypothetical protein
VIATSCWSSRLSCWPACENFLVVGCYSVKAYLRHSYRGIVELLALSDGLRQAWKLQRVPDHSTLQKFSQRAVHPEGIDRWLAQLLEWVQPAAETVAMDATGWESTPSSAYYQTRRGQRRKGYVQVSRLMVCGNLFPCRVQIAQWPCNDEMATRNRHVHVLGQVHRGGAMTQVQVAICRPVGPGISAAVRG